MDPAARRVASGQELMRLAATFSAWLAATWAGDVENAEQHARELADAGIQVRFEGDGDVQDDGGRS